MEASLGSGWNPKLLYLAGKRCMFTGDEIVSVLQQLGTTDVVWIPDSAIGLWETALVRAKGLRLIRVCREGEAWPLAAGLLLGGKRPMVIMQSTGIFES